MVSPFKDSSSQHLEVPTQPTEHGQARPPQALSRITSVGGLSKLPEERQPLLGPTDTAERARDASHHTGYSALSNEALPGPTDTAAGAEVAPSSYCDIVVDAFFKHVRDVCCCREPSPAQDAPPQDASADPESANRVGSSSDIMGSGARGKLPKRRATDSVLGQVPDPSSDQRVSKRAATIGETITSIGETSTTRGNLDFSEQRLWKEFNESTLGDFEQRMTEICDQKALVISHRAKLFIYLDNELREKRLKLQKEEFEKIIEDTSREDKSILDTCFEEEQRWQAKQGDMDENHPYRSLQKMRRDLKLMQDELEDKKSRIAKMKENIKREEDTKTGKSSITDRRATSSRATSSRATPSIRSMYEGAIRDLEERVGKLSKEIGELGEKINPLESQKEVQDLEGEHNDLVQLRKKRDDCIANVHREVDQGLEKHPEIQGLKQKRHDAGKRMIYIAEYIIEQIDNEQFNQYIEKRKVIIGGKMIGINISKDEQERTGFSTQELTIEAVVSNETKYKVIEFIAFATALRDLHGQFTQMHEESLKRIGGQFKARHEGKLINALSKTADKLEEDLPLEDKQTLKIAQKIWQAEKSLLQDEKNTLETTLIRTRRGDRLSAEERKTLKIALKIRRKESLSQEEKEDLDDMLMGSLKPSPKSSKTDSGGCLIM